MSDNAPRIGAIGFGARGYLLNQLVKAGAKIVALADPSAEAKKRFSEAYDTAETLVDDYRAILDDKTLDAVIVMSPDFMHEEHGLAALQAGKFTYLEKPLSITTESADKLLEADVAAGGRLFVGHNLRCHPVLTKMKQLIDAGAIGEVKAAWCRHFVSYGGDFYFKDWHAESRYVNGLLLQKGCHDIDVLHWLCGSHTVRVAGMGGLTLYDKAPGKRKREEPGNAKADRANWPPLAQKGLNPDMDVEDVSMIHMQLASGVFCSYEQCHFTPDVWRNYTIIGSEGRIENFDDRPGNAVVRVINRRTGYNPHGDEQYLVHGDEEGHGGADRLICAQFVAYVRGEAKPAIAPIEARHAVATGDYGTRSIRNGNQPYDIPAAPQLVTSR